MCGLFKIEPKFILLTALLVSNSASSDEFQCTKSTDEYKGQLVIQVATDDQNIGITSNDIPGKVIIQYVKISTEERILIGSFWMFERPKGLGKEVFDIDRKDFPATVSNSRIIAQDAIFEAVQSEVTKKYLEDHRHSGIKMRIYGEFGQVDLAVFPLHIDAFLTCLISHINQ